MGLGAAIVLLLGALAIAIISEMKE